MCLVRLARDSTSCGESTLADERFYSFLECRALFVTLTCKDHVSLLYSSPDMRYPSDTFASVMRIPVERDDYHLILCGALKPPISVSCCDHRIHQVGEDFIYRVYLSSAPRRSLKSEPGNKSVTASVVRLCDRSRNRSPASASTTRYPMMHQGPIYMPDRTP